MLNYLAFHIFIIFVDYVFVTIEHFIDTAQKNYERKFPDADQFKLMFQARKDKLITMQQLSIKKLVFKFLVARKKLEFLGIWSSQEALDALIFWRNLVTPFRGIFSLPNTNYVFSKIDGVILHNTPHITTQHHHSHRTVQHHYNRIWSKGNRVRSKVIWYWIYIKSLKNFLWQILLLDSPGFRHI